MIREIKLENFKCIPQFTFNLNKVNLFTGYNGRGKSSVLQSILMMSQSIKKDRLNSLERLHLNGTLIDLGDFDEILTNDRITNLGIELVLENDDKNHHLSFGYQLSDDDIKVGTICRCIIDHEDYFDTVGGNNNPDTSTPKSVKQFPSYINSILGMSNIHYVAADRLGPVKFVEKLEVPEFHRVGKNGIFTINTLSTYKENIPIEMNLDKNDYTEHNLQEAATQWMGYIMGNGYLYVNDGKGKERTTTLSLEFQFQSKDSTRSFQSYNVGFGYSYVLSIIVTALIAKKGNIVIIENPEAHLHPQAQKHIAYMLAKLASRGVQVFIETHSEHIVNAFRLAALKNEYKLSNDDMSIFFFDSDYKIQLLHIEPSGRIPNWPKGFFDQYQQELAEIMTLGAKHI